MTSIAMVGRVIFNILLFVLYFMITHVIVGFVAGAFTTYILGYPIASEGAVIWDVLAIVSLLVVFIITLAWRKYFYLCLDKAQKKC